jgi:hypothetical protein
MKVLFLMIGLGSPFCAAAYERGTKPKFTREQGASKATGMTRQVVSEAELDRGTSVGVADGRSLTIKPGKEFSADSYVHKPLTDDATSILNHRCMWPISSGRYRNTMAMPT